MRRLKNEWVKFYKNKFLVLFLLALVGVEALYLFLSPAPENPLSFFITCTTYNVYALLGTSIVLNATLVGTDLSHGAIQFQLMGTGRRGSLVLAKFVLTSLLFLLLFLLMEGLVFFRVSRPGRPFLDAAALESGGYTVADVRTLLLVSLALVGLHLWAVHSVTFAVSTFFRNMGFMILMCLALYALSWVLSNLFLSGIVTETPLAQIMSLLNRISQVATGFVSAPWEAGEVWHSVVMSLFLFVFSPMGAIILFSRRSLG